MPPDDPQRSTSPVLRTWRAQAGVLLVVWLVLTGIVIGIGRIITGPLDDTLTPPENDLARWFVDERSSWLSPLADAGTLLGDTTTVIVLGVVLATAMWLWRREPRAAVLVVMTMVGATALYLLAVTVAPRPRPPVAILDPGLDPTHSFPSGHVGASIALYGVAAVLVWAHAGRARWWLVPWLVLVPVAVALSRLYEGAHHLSDVLTSVAYASAWLAATTVVLLSPERAARV